MCKANGKTTTLVLFLDSLSPKTDVRVSSCWMTLRKQEVTGSLRRKLRIALFGELSLEEAMDLRQDRLHTWALLLQLVVLLTTANISGVIFLRKI
jgi:hypothetical protein